MNAIELLLNRNSSPRLTQPAPKGSDLEQIYQAGFRAPDHARLRPWRFLAIEEDGLAALGELFADALLNRKPDASVQEVEKVKSQPLRAPLIVVAIAKLQEHEKVPAVEQILSAGCAVHGMVLAAQALGYAGIWRTGENAFDRYIMKGLGLAENEQIVGYLYLGTMDGGPKPIPEVDSKDYVSAWP